MQTRHSARATVTTLHATPTAYVEHDWRFALLIYLSPVYTQDKAAEEALDELSKEGAHGRAPSKF